MNATSKDRALTARLFLWVIVGTVSCVSVAKSAQAAALWPRNTETPFAYLPGNERSWQLTDHPLNVDETLTYTNEMPEGIDVLLSPSGKLTVRAAQEIRHKLELEIVMSNLMLS